MRLHIAIIPKPVVVMLGDGNFILKDGKQLTSYKHLGYISKERNHERIYFMDIQSVDEKSKYEIQ